jgi:hypothetical protein
MHHNNDTESFKQAKVCFYTDEALVLKQVSLEQEMRAACEETKVLLYEIQESKAELAWVLQNQLQVVGGIYKVGGMLCYSRSAPSEPSQPQKCQHQTHTSSQCHPMTPPFTSEQGPLYADSRSE